MTEKEKQEMLLKIQRSLEKSGLTVIHAIKIPEKSKKVLTLKNECDNINLQHLK